MVFKKGNKTWNTGLTKETNETIRLQAQRLSDMKKGKPLSETTKAKLKGRISWSKGLTKETDERLKSTSEKLKGRPFTEEHKRNLMWKKYRPTWDKGLTKETDSRIALYGLKVSETRNSQSWKEMNPVWNKGHTKETDSRLELFSIKFSGEKNPMFGKGLKGKNNGMYGKIVYPRLRFVPDLNHHVRSMWEENICRFLQRYNIQYQYEKERFNLQIDGTEHTYTPDIKINDKLYIEIKGPFFIMHYKKLQAFLEQDTRRKLILIHGDNGKQYLHKLILNQNLMAIHYNGFETKLNETLQTQNQS